jgi:hypothetical protein
MGWGTFAPTHMCIWHLHFHICAPTFAPQYLRPKLVRESLGNPCETNLCQNKLYKTVQELKDAIWKAWVDMNQETIDNLVHSMENHIFQLIKAWPWFRENGYFPWIRVMQAFSCIRKARNRFFVSKTDFWSPSDDKKKCRNTIEQPNKNLTTLWSLYIGNLSVCPRLKM